MLIRLGAEGEGGVGEEEAVVFELGAGASSRQMDVMSDLAVVALAEAGGIRGASTLGNSLYLLTPLACLIGPRLSLLLSPSPPRVSRMR